MATVERGKDGLRTDVYYGALEETEAKGYRAAGILLLRKRPTTEGPSYFEATTTTSSSSSIQVLCCAEVRKKKKQKPKNGIVELNLLGGKIEDADGTDSRVTAAREFWEETGGMVPLAECQRILNHDNKVLPIWCGPGKYALYVAYDGNNNPQWDQLPVTYSEALQSGKELPEGAEASHLVWVDWAIIQQCSQSRKKKKKPANDSIGSDDGTISFLVPSADNTDGERITVQQSNFVKYLFPDSNFQGGVELAIQKFLPSSSGTETTSNKDVKGSEGASGTKDAVEAMTRSLESVTI
ncbi:expressed unknown protein [Seminavis robusta]|uniref:Nudix hydrolase domain-containing protein n=1 Tax=Seminavis robusta TaxID=568900 RepID=A0A9N8EXG0_9STRA|nr:expressed unknown protein [Seminavis robusta]|eukprot:Sro1987_g309590.1 n/a (296) ;mRNA; r:15742-16629